MLVEEVVTLMFKIEVVTTVVVVAVHSRVEFISRTKDLDGAILVLLTVTLLVSMTLSVDDLYAVVWFNFVTDEGVGTIDDGMTRTVDTT